jgi:gluconate 2-dehydrogenase gamma chain
MESMPSHCEQGRLSLPEEPSPAATHIFSQTHSNPELVGNKRPAVSSPTAAPNPAPIPPFFFSSLEPNPQLAKNQQLAKTARIPACPTCPKSLHPGLPKPSPAIYDSHETISGGVTLKRRSFLAAAAITTAACSKSNGRSANLTDIETTTLEPWVDTLIPADQDPGARDANVVTFIDRQLSRKYRKQKPAYQNALRVIDRLAARAHGQPFHLLSMDQRVALLSNLESGLAKPEFSDGGKAAFEMILAHTQQGFYGDPRHGGNRDYASWRMIGVSPMPIRGRQHYEVQS